MVSYVEEVWTSTELSRVESVSEDTCRERCLITAATGCVSNSFRSDLLIFTMSACLRFPLGAVTHWPLWRHHSGLVEASRETSPVTDGDGPENDPHLRQHSLSLPLSKVSSDTRSVV